MAAMSKAYLPIDKKSLTRVRAVCVRCGKMSQKAINLRFKSMKVKSRVVSKNKKNSKKRTKICTYQKKAVILQRGKLGVELLKL